VNGPRHILCVDIDADGPADAALVARMLALDGPAPALAPSEGRVGACEYGK
jgi:hypothetical protein